MVYLFGVFEFDAASGELRKAGRAVAFEPQPARALGLLVSRCGEVVSRDELIAHVWGSETHVDFNRGLAYCVAQIRMVLGDSGESPRFVQTLPKRGFKFIAPVKTIQRQDPTSSIALAHTRPVAQHFRPAVILAAILFLILAGAWAARRALSIERPVVAVSLFDNETGDSRYDRPVHTMADVVVDRLTGLGQDRLGVVGNALALRMPRSERDLKTIEEQTGASFVILAQLQNRDTGLSLLMHLIRLDDGTHLWTRRIARSSGDSLAGVGEAAAVAIEGAVRQFITRDAANP